MSFEALLKHQQMLSWADWHMLGEQYSNSPMTLLQQLDYSQNQAGLNYQSQDHLEQQELQSCAAPKKKRKLSASSSAQMEMQIEDEHEWTCKKVSVQDQSMPSANSSEFNGKVFHRNTKGKSKKIKKEAYPTKNFLPTFRTSFLSYLKEHYRGSLQFERIEIVRRIRGKKCINMKDYEDLFNYPEFRPILERYFAKKVIIRDLMLSRIERKVKREYFKRVHVFEEAFRSGKFDKINY